MKKILFVCTMLSVLGMSSCQDEKDLYQEKPIEEQVNTSDFSTSRSVQLTVDYSEANAKTLFYVYDKNPLTFGENTVSLDNSIKPLDAAWTDDNGKFVGTMELPAYVSDVYIVSRAYYAQTLMTGKIANGVLSVSDTDQATTRVATRASGYNSKRFSSMGWSTALGNFDSGKSSSTGKINYAYQGTDEKLKLTPAELSDMKTTVFSVLKIDGTCPEDYRTDKGDLYVVEDKTEVVLTALGGNTCWNNSLGYYFYKENEAPTDIKKDVTVYTIFPNCQSGWTQGTASSIIKNFEGTAVQLKYFDDENPNGTVYFPKGYRIGFVLACNAWDTYYTSYGSQAGFMSSSTQAFNTPVKNVVKARTAMFSKGDIIALAFEDHKDDENFTDVVFALKSKPALSDVPKVDEENNTTVTKVGVYGFEDLWPKAADYDMNDVMAEYTYEKTFTPENVYLQESFTFQTFANKADLDNGLALILKSLPAADVIVEDSIMYADADEFVPVAFEHESDNGNAVVKFTDNVKGDMNAKYKVTVKYNKDLGKNTQTAMDAFIYRPANNGRIEIHCPMKTPTSTVDDSFFGQEDDRSIPESNIYYVSGKESIYPFAFYLDGATISDVAPLLKTENESTPISELYPNFIGWAKNGTNPDWYK